MNAGPPKKKVALLGIPDDALDVLNHYTQGSEWETVVVISGSPEAYAARMAEVLGIPVQEIPHRDQLAACDLVIVGDDSGMEVDAVRTMLEDEPVLVADLDEVWRELALHCFEDGDADRGLDADPDPDMTSPLAADAVNDVLEQFTPDPSSFPDPPALVARPKSNGGPLVSKDRPLFDLSACLSREAGDQFSAVPIDGESGEFQALLAEVLSATGAQTGSIMLPDLDGEHLAIAASIGLPREIVTATRPRLGEGLAGRAFATGLPAVLQGEVPQFAEAAGLTHRVAASVPIQRESRRLGVLSINVDSQDPIVEMELIKILDRFIEPAHRAVLRSVDLAELPPPARREILFRSLDAIMALEASFPERLVETGEALRKAVRADFAHVYLIDPLGQRLELISPVRGMASTEGRYLSLDRGFYSWIVDRGAFQLLTADDEGMNIQRAVACLPVRTSRPYGLLVLEHFKMRPEEQKEIRDLLVSVIQQLEEIFEIEQGVESQDILAGLRLRIADKKDELEMLPATLRAQSALEFTIQVLAAEAAVWVEGPGARPVIAQPQTRQAARIVADVWDSLDALCGWIRESGSVASGGTGPGWEQGAPPSPAPYVGVRDDRAGGVIIMFFAAEERLGPSTQLPARILTEALRGICGLIPVEETTSDEPEGWENAA